MPLAIHFAQLGHGPGQDMQLRRQGDRIGRLAPRAHPPMPLLRFRAGRLRLLPLCRLAVQPLHNCLIQPLRLNLCVCCPSNTLRRRIIRVGKPETNAVRVKLSWLNRSVVETQQIKLRRPRRRILRSGQSSGRKSLSNRPKWRAASGHKRVVKVARSLMGRIALFSQRRQAARFGRSQRFDSWMKPEGARVAHRQRDGVAGEVRFEMLIGKRILHDHRPACSRRLQHRRRESFGRYRFPILLRLGMVAFCPEHFVASIVRHIPSRLIAESGAESRLVFFQLLEMRNQGKHRDKSRPPQFRIPRWAMPRNGAAG